MTLFPVADIKIVLEVLHSVHKGVASIVHARRGVLCTVNYSASNLVNCFLALFDRVVYPVHEVELEVQEEVD